MGLFSKLSALGAGRRLAKAHAPTVHRGVDSAAHEVEGRVGERHRSKVRTGASFVKRVLTGSSGTTSGDRSTPEARG
jgi:hypothetical protein